MIKETNQLNTHQLQELQHLMKLCKQHDGSIPNLYTHILSQHRTLPVNQLYYAQEQLIGFLSVYFFYDDAVEIALLVAPSARQHGIGKQLMQKVIPIIKEQNFQNLIFSSPAQLNDHWLKAKNFSYLHSEYFMERRDLNPVLEYTNSLTFRKATGQDIPILCAIDEVCFPKHHGNLADRFQLLIDSREYQIIIAIKDNHPIGKAHIRWHDEAVTLSDIAILPTQQGKGLGSALIAHCINQALSEGKPQINLDVETHNLRALNLYTQLGFLVQNACDYWKININKFSK